MNPNFEKIEEFLEGELVGSELLKFENALLNDSEFNQLVSEHKEMRDRLEALRLRKKVNSILLEESNKKVSPKFNLRLLSIAASITFALITLWLLYPSKDKSQLIAIQNTMDSTVLSTIVKTDTGVVFTQIDSIVNTNPISEKRKNGFSPILALVSSLIIIPNEISLRSVEETNDRHQKTDLELALLSHSKKEYRTAIQFFNKIENISSNDEAVFLRGNSYFMTQQYTQSLKDFQSLSNNIQFKHEASWNQLLTQILLANNREIDHGFKMMIEDVDYPYRENAIKLKAQLKELDVVH